MKFIKEILKHNPEKHGTEMPQHRIVVRTNTYGSNIEFFQELYDEVKKDFPHITPKDADVKHYGGQHYKRTYGIEFNINLDIAVPDGYGEISGVEYTL